MGCFQKVGVGTALGVCVAFLGLFIGIGKPDMAHASDAQLRALETVCENWPIPTGYVIVGVQDTKSCQGYPTEYVVTPAADGLAVCDSSPIPDGFVVASIKTNAGPAWATCRTPTTYRIATAGPGVAMCSISSRPSGYVVNRVTASSQCLGNNAYVLQPVVQGVIACSFSRPPDGYVVIAGQQTSNCTDGSLKGDYWTFVKAYDSVNVCPYSPTPVGFYVVGTVNKTNCFGASFGYLLRKL